MPLYEYRCPKCSETKEVLARSTEAATGPSCAACGLPMEKAWAPVANCRTSSGSTSCKQTGGFS